MDYKGSARTEITLIDYSKILNTSSQGLVAMLVNTAWGPVGVPTLISSPQEFQATFGSQFFSDSTFLANDFFQRGGVGKVVRCVKYVDPNQPSTFTGAKATVTNTQSSVSAVGATATATLYSRSATTDGTITLVVHRPGQADIVILDSFTVTHTDSLSTNVTALVAALNALSNGWTGTASGSSFTVTAPSSLGAAANAYTLEALVGNCVVNPNVRAFSGGVNATVNTASGVFTAKYIGALGNSMTVAISLAASKKYNCYDITVSLPGFPSEIFADVPASGSDRTTAINKILANSQFLGAITLTSSYVFVPGTTLTLSSGADSNAMSASDYVGGSLAATNMYALDADLDCNKIWVPNIIDPTMDIALANYCDSRQDMGFIVGTPVGAAIQTVEDYRNGTGSYSHSPVNSYRGFMSMSGLQLLNSQTNTWGNYSETSAVAAAMSKRDNNYYPWYSFAGYTRGLIDNAKDLIVDISTPSRASWALRADNAGVNWIKKDTDKNLVIFNNRSLYRDQTSLLSEAGVAEFLIWLYRYIFAMTPKFYFEPNDPITWKNVVNVLEAGLKYAKDNRALGDYIIVGDQDVVNASQASLNTSQTISAGAYKVAIQVSPTVQLKYINIELGVTNSGISFKVV